MSNGTKYTNTTPGSIPTPGTGKTTIFVDSTDKHSKQKDDTGSVIDLTAASGGGPSGDVQQHLFYADQFDNPNNANWAVNKLAPTGKDDINNSLSIRKFNDNFEKGVGWMLSIPTGKTNMKLSFKSRAKTAPATAKKVSLNLYTKEYPDNAAPSTFSVPNALNDIDIPTNTNFQYDSQILTLASLSLTAGRLNQFELTRDVADVNDTLVDDWYLAEVIVEFT